MNRVQTNKHANWVIKQRIWRPTDLVDKQGYFEDGLGTLIALKSAVDTSMFAVDTVTWRSTHDLRYDNSPGDR